MIFLTPSIITLQVVGKNTSIFDAETASSNGKLILSDHKRSPLSINYEILEKFARMADGTARKQVIAKKRSFSCSWDMLPTVKTQIIDSNADALDLKRFFEIYSAQPITMSLFHKRNSQELSVNYQDSYTVFLNSFDYDVVKRFKNFDYWNISIEFMEI